MAQNNKTNVMRILDSAKISYTPLFYTPDKEFTDGLEIVNKLSLDASLVYKTLITRNGHDFFVFVIPVMKELDLKKAAKAVNQKAVELIHVNELLKISGYVRGGCSPVGMKKAFPTVIDLSAKELPEFYVSAGKIGAQIKLSPLDLSSVINATFEDITR